MNLPSVSIIIPTYNSAKVLKGCLAEIRKQDYPRNKIEIIIADAGSTDRTLKIAKEFHVNKIVHNKLKTAEAGKAAGLKEAKNEIVALVDSDNILDGKDWLKRMVAPFADKKIVGTEPIKYTYRKKDGLITRYCALIGANDPLCIFLGNYDRRCLLTGRWTGLPVYSEDKGDYLKITLKKGAVPTIGANGFLIRKNELVKCSVENYLFDIDIVTELVEKNKNKFAKVKTGIVHIFSGNSSTFARKQRRRVNDFMYYKKLGARKYPWQRISKIGILKFVAYCILVLPLIAQAVIGYSRKADSAWLFHPVACWITLWTYAVGSIRGTFSTAIENRENWRQTA